MHPISTIDAVAAPRCVKRARLRQPLFQASSRIGHHPARLLGAVALGFIPLKQAVSTEAPWLKRLSDEAASGPDTRSSDTKPRDPGLLGSPLKIRKQRGDQPLPERRLETFHREYLNQKLRVHPAYWAFRENQAHVRRCEKRAQHYLTSAGEVPTRGWAKQWHAFYTKYAAHYRSRVRRQATALARVDRRLQASIYEDAQRKIHFIKALKQEEADAIRKKLLPRLETVKIGFELNRLNIDDSRLTHCWDPERMKILTTSSAGHYSGFDRQGMLFIEQWCRQAVKLPSLVQAFRSVSPLMPQYVDRVGIQIPMESTNEVACWQKKDNALLGDHRRVLVLVPTDGPDLLLDDFDQEAFERSALQIRRLVMAQYNVPEANIEIVFPHNETDLKAAGERLKAAADASVKKGITPELLWVTLGHGTGRAELDNDPGLPDACKKEGCVSGQIKMTEGFYVNELRLKAFAKTYASQFRTLAMFDSCFSGNFLAQRMPQPPRAGSTAESLYADLDERWETTARRGESVARKKKQRSREMGA